jgi:hypothetical protein
LVGVCCVACVLCKVKRSQDARRKSGVGRAKKGRAERGKSEVRGDFAIAIKSLVFSLKPKSRCSNC